MTVSRRTRFEILRRDNHSCRYCGSVAPDVTLHVDHVIPVSLGGSDDPSNLVAACKDCNAGKSSTSPAENHVADVSDKAFALAEAFRSELAKEVDSVRALAAYRNEFRAAWDGWTYKEQTAPLPNDWAETLGHWYRIGVPMEIVTSAIDTAMVKKGLSQADGEFRYMCGVVWRTLDNIQQRTLGAESVDQPAGIRIVKCANHETCGAFTVMEPEDEGPSTCSGCEGTNMWQDGWNSGKARGHREARLDQACTDFVALHIDRMESGISKSLRLVT